MRLSKIFNNINKNQDKHFKNLKINSNYCKPNDVFFAILGKKHDGNNYINEAIKNGAKTIVSSRKFHGSKNNILYIKYNDPKKLLAKISGKIYKKKPNNLIAVTGTNGKSSVSDFYYQILKLNKIKSASIGTLGVKSEIVNNKISNTTMDILFNNKILDKLSTNNIQNVIMEASSHGLHQGRLDGIKFDTAIFTNLTRDHLDYHKSYKNYLNSKLILFKRLIKKRGVIIFDSKSPQAKILSKLALSKKFKILKLNDYNGIKIIKHTSIKEFQHINFMFKGKNFYFKTKLVGKIQISNLLMSVLAASKFLPMKKIVESLKFVKPVIGRLEVVQKLKNNSTIILDYCHTPDALSHCLQNIKDQYKLSKINLVFGCGGERDKQKRQIMGKIANQYCNKIYLTDDNPRNENPNLIRKAIKKFIKKNKLLEIPSREKAIKTSIEKVESGEVLIIAGKGHENYQEYKKKISFSDRYFIKKYSKIKNKTLSNYWKTNLFNEELKILKLNKNINIENVSINSKKIIKNSVFFGLKGKNFNGSKFAAEANKNNALFSVIETSKKKLYQNKKVKVKNSLKTLSKISTNLRCISNIQAIAVTGSSGKTSVKELLGHVLSKILPTTYSKKSYNNKFGVPISLFNIKKRDFFGIFETGMDKKGEIEKLTKLIKPNVGLITNISYAHIKNFKNLKGIANAKSEIIDGINEGGCIILNKDDKFYNYLHSKSIKKKIKIVSFGKNKGANVSFKRFETNGNLTSLYITFNKKEYCFKIENYLKDFISNILCVIAVISIYFDLRFVNKNIFLNYKIPKGRGNKSVIKLGNKRINVIDESYNSNPSSLNFALQKLDKIKTKSKKIALLGDMLELGKYSKKLHISASDLINKTNIDKVYVYGNYIRHTFNKIKTQKKGKIIIKKDQIINTIKQVLRNNDYLMIKGSNSTGLKNIVLQLKN